MLLHSTCAATPRDLDGSGDGWSDLEVDIPSHHAAHTHAGVGRSGDDADGGPLNDALGGLTLLDGGGGGLTT